MLYTLSHPLIRDPFVSPRTKMRDGFKARLSATLYSNTMSTYQINPKLKPMVKVSRYVIYSITPSHTRSFRISYLLIDSIQTHMSYWLRIPCQRIKSTQILKRWLKFQNMLYTQYITSLTRDPLEVTESTKSLSSWLKPEICYTPYSIKL